MAKQLELRRGTTQANNLFTGAAGEVTMDTTNKTLRVHDGQTPGGIPLAKQSEIPTIPQIDIANETGPDTSNQINIGAYDTYTFPNDGWLIIMTNMASSVQFTSDKYTVSQYAPFAYGCLNPNGACQSLMYRVQSGETITKTYASGNWKALFVPCKD